MVGSILNTQLDEIRRLLKQNKVKKAYLFGSACTGKFNKESDIDILIVFKDGLDPIEYGNLWWDLYFSLENLLHRKIDLITEGTIKNPYLLKEIERTRQEIL
jgi:uncharacterized protein